VSCQHALRAGMYRTQRTDLKSGAKDDIQQRFNKAIFIDRLGKNAHIKPVQNYNITERKEIANPFKPSMCAARSLPVTVLT
jgi:hypothetical protein